MIRIFNDSSVSLTGEEHNVILNPPSKNYFKVHSFRDFFNTYIFEEEKDSSQALLLPRRSQILQDIEKTQLKIKDLLDKKQITSKEKKATITTQQHDKTIEEYKNQIDTLRSKKAGLLKEGVTLSNKLQVAERKAFSQSQERVVTTPEMKQIQKEINDNNLKIQQIELNVDQILSEKQRIENEKNNLTLFENKNKEINSNVQSIDSSIIDNLDELKNSILGDLNRLKVRLEDLEKIKTNNTDRQNSEYNKFSNFVYSHFPTLLKKYSVDQIFIELHDQIKNYIGGFNFTVTIPDFYLVFYDILYLTTLFYLKSIDKISREVYRVYSILTAQALDTTIFLRNE